MSATQPLMTLSNDSRELLRTLLEAPPPSLDLLCIQLSDIRNESPVELSIRAIDAVHTWPTSDKAAFIHGHPRIGEQSNLSALSAAEQAKYATPLEVLERLRVLNLEYERRFEGLRYITFVAGRSRAQIVQEMEELLKIPTSMQPNGETPAPLGPRDAEWESELNRAIIDIGRIAQDRASKMSTQ